MSNCISSVSPNLSLASKTDQHDTSPLKILSQLATSLPLDQKIVLLEQLHSLSESDINAAIHNDELSGRHKDKLSERWIDDLLNTALEQNDEKFATYLVEKQGADLTRCKAFYQLPLDWQLEALVNKLIDTINTTPHLSEAVPLQFQLTIGEENPQLVTLSLQEARKLAEISSLFQVEWENGDNGTGFFLPQLHNVDSTIFQKVIQTAIGQKVDPVSKDQISSLVTAVNYLNIVDSSLVMLPLITHDNLIAYLDSNFLTPEDLQTLHTLQQPLNQQVQEKFIDTPELLVLSEEQKRQQLEALLQKQQNLQDYKNIAIDMVLEAKSDENSASVGTTISTINNHPGPLNNIFNTQPNYEFLIHQGNRAKTPLRIKRVARLIAAFTFANPDAQKLFATSVVRDMLIKMGTQATSDEEIRAIANAIANIAHDNPDAQNLFATDAVRSMLITMGNLATSNEAIHGVANAIGNIANNNPDAQKLFATPDVHSMLITMGNLATSNEAIHGVAAAIANIVYNNPAARNLFANPVVRGMLITMGNLATSNEAIHGVAVAIANIVYNNPAAQNLFANPVVRSMLITMGNLATSNEAIHGVTAAIANIVYNNPAAQNLLTNCDVVNILITMGNLATSNEAIDAIASAIASIANNNPDLRNSVIPINVCSMLFKMGNLATSNEAIDAIARAISSIAKQNRPWKKLFTRDNQFRDTMVAMGERATSNEAIQEIINAINNVILHNRIGKSRFPDKLTRGMLENMRNTTTLPRLKSEIYKLRTYLSFPRALIRYLF